MIPEETSEGSDCDEEEAVAAGEGDGGGDQGAKED